MVRKPLLRTLTQNSLCQGGWQCHRTFAESEGEWSLPWGLSGQECTCNAGKADSIPGSGRSPGEGTGNPLQYSCLGNPMDRGAWWAIVHGGQRVGYDLATKQQ